MLVTATDEWSTHTLIGGIVPNIYGGQVSYRIQYGYLTNAIAENWAINIDDPKSWQNPARTSISVPSALDRNKKQEYRGRWLVIDEFNRAPIDIALGETVTSLSSSNGTTLRVPIEGGSASVKMRGMAPLGVLQPTPLCSTANFFCSCITVFAGEEPTTP